MYDVYVIRSRFSENSLKPKIGGVIAPSFSNIYKIKLYYYAHTGSCD